MKTSELTDNDLLELKLLADKLGRDLQTERTRTLRASSKPVTSDAERELTHGEEVLRKILRSAK